MILLYIGISLFCLILIWDIATSKYKNPYTFTIILGEKGSGKSTYLAKLASRYIKRGWTVYADLGNTDVPGVIPVDLSLGVQNLPIREHSVLFIDEASMLYNNRDFKSFDRKTESWFREQRKHKCKVYAFSQDWSLDLKLRNLADYICMQRKYLRVFSVTTMYRHKIRLLHSDETHTDEAKFVDDFILLPGGDITFIPRWVGFFDSSRILSRR